MSYNDKLDPDTQITAEEDIAHYLFSNEDIEADEEVAAQAGRDILLMVLTKFRPDLVSGK